MEEKNKNYEGVLYRENSRVNPFRRVDGKIFELKKNILTIQVMNLLNCLLSCKWIPCMEYK